MTSATDAVASVLGQHARETITKRSQLARLEATEQRVGDGTRVLLRLLERR